MQLSVGPLSGEVAVREFPIEYRVSVLEALSDSGAQERSEPKHVLVVFVFEYDGKVYVDGEREVAKYTLRRVIGG